MDEKTQIEKDCPWMTDAEIAKTNSLTQQQHTENAERFAEIVDAWWKEH